MYVNPPFEILPFKDSYKSQMISVWERSVLASHQFLSNEDFFYYKKLLSSFDFNALDTFCLMVEMEIIGFIAVSEAKVEMLFLLPEYLGMGLGTSLIQFALLELDAIYVDVNEQNEGALEFYQKMGFIVYERMELDDSGKPYPILKMQHNNLLIKSN